MDRVAHTRARDRARWLVRDHGAAAETVLAAKIARAANNRPDRAFYKMIRRELKILRRIEAEASHSTVGPLARLMMALRGTRGPRDT